MAKYIPITRRNFLASVVYTVLRPSRFLSAGFSGGLAASTIAPRNAHAAEATTIIAAIGAAVSAASFLSKKSNTTADLILQNIELIKQVLEDVKEINNGIQKLLMDVDGLKDHIDAKLNEKLIQDYITRILGGRRQYREVVSSLQKQEITITPGMELTEFNKRRLENASVLITNNRSNLMESIYNTEYSTIALQCLCLTLVCDVLAIRFTGANPAEISSVLDSYIEIFNDSLDPLIPGSIENQYQEKRQSYTTTKVNARKIEPTIHFKVGTYPHYAVAYSHPLPLGTFVDSKGRPCPALNYDCWPNPNKIYAAIEAVPWYVNITNTKEIQTIENKDVSIGTVRFIRLKKAKIIFPDKSDDPRYYGGEAFGMYARIADLNLIEKNWVTEGVDASTPENVRLAEERFALWAIEVERMNTIAYEIAFYNQLRELIKEATRIAESIQVELTNA